MSAEAESTPVDNAIESLFSEDAIAARTEQVRKATENAKGPLTLSNGIVIKGRPVAQSLMRRVIDIVPVPKMPQVWLEDQDRNEENPNDPEYRAALTTMHLARLQAARRLLLTMGLQIVSVPEGFPGPDDDEWVEEMEVAGVEIDVSSPSKRRWEWLNLYALAEPTDGQNAYGLAVARTGLIEAEVIAAIAYFRSEALRPADPVPPTRLRRVDRDRSGAADAGTGGGVRGEGSGADDGLQLEPVGETES